MADGERRTAISEWLDSVIQDFGERILPVNIKVARRWANVSPSLRAAGAVIGVVDELIAATALAHGLTLVTRNVRHFEPTGCKLLSPWSG